MNFNFKIQQFYLMTFLWGKKYYPKFGNKLKGWVFFQCKTQLDFILPGLFYNSVGAEVNLSVFFQQLCNKFFQTDDHKDIYDPIRH